MAHAAELATVAVAALADDCGGRAAAAVGPAAWAAGPAGAAVGAPAVGAPLARPPVGGPGRGRAGRVVVVVAAAAAAAAVGSLPPVGRPELGPRMDSAARRQTIAGPKASARGR